MLKIKIEAIFLYLKAGEDIRGEIELNINGTPIFCDNLPADITIEIAKYSKKHICLIGDEWEEVNAKWGDEVKPHKAKELVKLLREALLN